MDVDTDIATALDETAKKLNAMVADGDQRTRNLMMIRHEYARHLQQTSVWKQYDVPGIPIILKDGDLRLDRMLLHTRLYGRSFFEAKPQGGTELVYTSQHRGGAGFQWYIMSWKLNKGNLTVWATHWMIDRDTDTKRNTVHFNRGFAFTESDEHTIENTKVTALFEDWTHMSKVPDRHRRALKQAVEHSLRDDMVKDKEEGWVTVTATNGIFEQITKYNHMLRVLDMGEHSRWYLNNQFKHFWSLRVLEAVWGKEWTTKKFDTDGILKELWYYPDTSHFLDKERFDKIKAEWDTVRDEYTEWLDKFRFPPHGRSPPPPADDT